jgi:GT2 family glycosyltransferase
MPRLTVAVSTFRETYFELVIQLLKCLENQTFRDFKVLIVVNSNERYFQKLFNKVNHKSNPNTAFEVDVIFNPTDLGIAHARNISLKTADTPYIAFTDDDIIPHNQWLHALLDTIETSDRVGAVTGPVIANWSLDSQEIGSWFPRELYWIIGCTPWLITTIKEVRNGFASNLALKRDIALECGGFNEDFGYNPRNALVGEEPEFGIRLRRMGKSTLWNPNAVVYHRITRNRVKLQNVLNRSFAEGKTKAYLRQILGKESTELEINHLQSVIKAFVKTKSLRSKALLASSTLAVLAGYLGSYGKSDRRDFL